MTETDVFLVGAGPLGLELAANLKALGVEYVHVEAKQIGHTISWYPRQTRFFSSPERISICGVPLMTPDQSKATREQYLTYLFSVAKQFDLDVRTYQRVTKIQVDCSSASSESAFLIETRSSAGSQTYRAKQVILTIGDMHQPRKLILPDGKQVPGSGLPHVSHYFYETHPYVNQRLLIVGGRNSAVEAAVRCQRAGAHVALSYRRSAIDDSVKYWIKPEAEWLIRNGQIDFFPETVPVSILPDRVVLAPFDGVDPVMDRDSHQEIPADFVLLLIGYEMDKSLLRAVGVTLRGPGGTPYHDDKTMETDVKGLFVAGTAAAGTQLRYRLFIENCHSHVLRIVREICGADPPHLNPLAYSRLEENPEVAES